MQDDPAFHPSLPLPAMPDDPEALAETVVQGGLLAAELARIVRAATAGRAHGQPIAFFALVRLTAEHHADLACDVECERWSPELAARLARYTMDAAASLAAELAHQKRPGAPWPEQPWPAERRPRRNGDDDGD